MAALRQLLSGLAPTLQAPVVAVCHTASEDPSLLLQALASASPLPVREAQERHPPLPGTVSVAPGGYHLLIERDGRFALSVDGRVRYSRPSIDVLFESAARCHGPALIGVVLTGANDDGAAGLAAIRSRGGLAVVQDPGEAEVPTMPQAAIQRAGADHITTLAGIAALLNIHSAT